MYQLPAAPQPIGVVLDNAIQLYRASFRSCWVVSLVGAIALAASGMFVTAQLRGVSLSGSGLQNAQGVARALSVSGFRAATFEADAVVFVGTLIVYGALLAQINNIAQGRPAQSVLDVFGVALRRLPGVILAAIVSVFAIVLGFVLFIIPGIYLWGKLQFWLAAVFADDVGAIESLGRSWNATQGNWWRSTTALGVALIIIFVIDLLLITAEGAFAGVRLVVQGADLAQILFGAQLLGVVFRVFTLPIIPAALLAIYYDLRLRREGGDLLARVNSIQST